MRVARDRVGLELEGVQFLQPRALIGREHAVGMALLGQHFVGRQQYLVLVLAEADAGRAQRVGDPPVAFDGGRLVSFNRNDWQHG